MATTPSPASVAAARRRAAAEHSRTYRERVAQRHRLDGMIVEAFAKTMLVTKPQDLHSFLAATLRSCVASMPEVDQHEAVATIRGRLTEAAGLPSPASTSHAQDAPPPTG